MKVQTACGVLSLALQIPNGKVSQVTVNMGEPVLKLADIPVDGGAVSAMEGPHQFSFDVGSQTISPATFVSMGNPHVVVFVEDVSRVDLPRVGPLVECFEAFPKRINAHWVQIKSPAKLSMRTWERGSGITLACGTGACAGVRGGRVDGADAAENPRAFAGRRSFAGMARKRQLCLHDRPGNRSFQRGMDRPVSHAEHAIMTHSALSKELNAYNARTSDDRFADRAGSGAFQGHCHSEHGQGVRLDGDSVFVDGGTDDAGLSAQGAD